MPPRLLSKPPSKSAINHPGRAGHRHPAPGRPSQVKLHTPQRAITAGQAAVFYQDDLVLGGGLDYTRLKSRV